MDRSNQKNALLKSSMQSRAAKISQTEAFFESALQLHLRLYIFGVTGKIGT